MMPVHLGATASIWVSPPTTLPIIAFVPSMQIFPGGSDGKASVYNAGEPGSIPWSGRSPWRKKWLSTPVLLPENPMDRGAR